MGKNPFQAVGDARIRRSALDLSHSHLMSQKFGELVPLSPIEVLPGDVVDLGLSSFIRAQPLVRPPIGRTKLRTYTFYVPYRILWDEWERFIAGQEDYDPEEIYVAPELPYLPQGGAVVNNGFTAIGTLWDYFGFPTANASEDVYRPTAGGGPNGSYKAMTFPFDAYWLIYNEYFRVPGIQPKLIPDWSQVDDSDYAWQYRCAYRNHTRDYMTAALPWTQRGTPPALPVFGSITADTTFDTTVVPAAVIDNLGLSIGSPGDFGMTTGTATGKTRLDQALTDAANTSIADNLTTVDINDLRLAWQTQVFLERNARGGARYSETIQSHFKVKLDDGRIQRPEFLGGTVSDILFSEIPQTSTSTDSATPQGYIAGHGVGSDAQQITKFRVPEHGVIMTLVCITVDAVYNQGFPRSFARRLQLDFPWPEFVGLGEQEIFNWELYAFPHDGLDNDPFGFTGRYNEMRYLPNLVSGQLRPGQNQAQWTQSRSFFERPTLSSAFISTAPESASGGAWMRPFAVTDPDITPPFVAHYARKLNMLRPIPYLAEPSPILGG
nr:MAG: major capsid protein [Microvirus sp.]